jgi:F0F1-type ATP synthase assembly protein I
VNNQRRKPQPLAAAMEWVAKITTVGLEMMLPAVGGYFADRHFGTRYWVLVGMVVGVTVGFWHLLRMTKGPRGPRPSGQIEESTRGSPDR